MVFINRSPQHEVQSSRGGGVTALKPGGTKQYWLVLKLSHIQQKRQPSYHSNIQERPSAPLAMPLTDDRTLPKTQTCRQIRTALRHTTAEDKWDDARRLVGCEATRKVRLLETSRNSLTPCLVASALHQGFAVALQLASSSGNVGPAAFQARA